MSAPAPSPGFGTNLSLFTGLDPNGTWKLWLYDDDSGDGGSLAGGWALNLEADAADVSAPDSALLLLTGLGALDGVRRRQG